MFIKSKWFWFTISLYILLGIYSLTITYSKPNINIVLEEINGAWIISDFFYKDWAENKQISIGDTVIQVDGRNVEDITNVKRNLSIRRANDLTLQKENGRLVHIKVNITEIPSQFYYIFVVPFCYYLLSLIISCYLYFKHKQDLLLNLLILFILTISLAYASIGASGVQNSIGIIVNRGSMILCLVLLIHFLKQYFEFLNIKWVFIDKIIWLYLIPVLIVFFGVYSVFYTNIYQLLSQFTLAIFLVLLVVVLGIIIAGYFIYKLTPLKVLLISVVTPFLPFLVLYVVPKLLSKQPIISAEVCSLFLMLIPYSFIFTQLTERIFDIQYYITRLRYYVNFSLVYALWIGLGMYWFTDISFSKISKLLVFACISLVMLFFIKEKIDYRKRKILFSTKGDYIHRLYTTIDSIGRVIKINDLLERFAKEVALHLEIDHTYVVTYNLETHQIHSTSQSKRFTQEQIDEILLEKLHVGTIKKTEHFYVAFIHQDIQFKRILVIDHHQSITLKDEELLWLELLILYVNNFIENTKQVEELLNQLKNVHEVDRNQLPWLNKLLWIRFEEEKYQLAQELHDTNLQEQLHIAREMDVLVHTRDVQSIQSKLSEIHEHMLTSLSDLRSYCENLKPPLLDTLGLSAALDKLLQKMQRRVPFVLRYTVDRLYLEDERLNLMIFRLFQELLNNALKHSQAKTVDIHLLETKEGFEIIYADDGVGCNIDEIVLRESMGIRGMQERVQAFNGQFIIQSTVGKGMSIRITVNEREYTQTNPDEAIANPFMPS
ncbi:ATP-binding protein [Lysinibacillus piscis]|uniref:histidine kinase n=1 Tax=Lysinibacillus piscis TaxID=2518931 RepID=A0ABQ5NK29_9BACI|nr:ATP-binding protein [Lysinibacillus sp. KH24]GLC88726.1 histidine kinase [Lysinibacillus sp. KH24]